ncbi:MAG: hypothetical protein AAF298_22990, partial [Cyanobacteria bacterium P01_A01_bin.40]
MPKIVNRDRYHQERRRKSFKSFSEESTIINSLLAMKTASLLDQPIISAHNLNHYFGQGELRKQVLFEI